MVFTGPHCLLKKIKKVKRNNMQPDISANTDELSRKVAVWMIGWIKEVLTRQDRFTIVLSGGSTPKKLYQLLASEKYRHEIDWSKLHFFWGDERYVPSDDERNNSKMAFDTLLNHVPVLKENIHIMRMDIEPVEAAASYESTLHQYFDDKPSTFDLVLLGLGDNAHTLSLFPGYEIIHERKKWVVAFHLAEQKMYRITLTVPVVNQASRVVFLVAGADKAVPLYHVLYGEHDPDLYPAQLIQPYLEKPWWFIDKAAASELEE
jgi:6-phosphogluconolactonase